MAVAQHVTVLDYGKVIGVGSAQQIQQNPAVIEAYFGSADLFSLDVDGNGSTLALEKS
jgi:ABC-type uncharacterized transport system ATPase subunit